MSLRHLETRRQSDCRRSRRVTTRMLRRTERSRSETPRGESSGLRPSPHPCLLLRMLVWQRRQPSTPLESQRTITDHRPLSPLLTLLKGFTNPSVQLPLRRPCPRIARPGTRQDRMESIPGIHTTIPLRDRTLLRPIPGWHQSRISHKRIHRNLILRTHISPIFNRNPRPTPIRLHSPIGMSPNGGRAPAIRMASQVSLRRMPRVPTGSDTNSLTLQRGASPVRMGHTGRSTGIEREMCKSRLLCTI